MVKYDGYRLRLERDGDRVRLITRGGYDWTDRAEVKSHESILTTGAWAPRSPR
jgi:ATP-dependent DNA ligase